jgi:hypothetical protein
MRVGSGVVICLILVLPYRADCLDDRAARLLALANQRFGELTPAETQMLQAACTGDLAACAQQGEDMDPANAAAWGAHRVIRADRIAWLCTDREASACVSYHGVRVLAARIEGRLDLEGAEVKFPLWFASCALAEDLNLRGSHLKVLFLQRTYVRAIGADDLRVDGGVFLREGFRASGAVRFLGGTIGGSLDCGGGVFGNADGEALNADRLRIDGSVFLNEGFKANGEVRLLGATIGGDLSCTRGAISNPKGYAFNADGLRVNGDVNLREGFKADGEVRLLGAIIGGQLNCAGGVFRNPVGSALDAYRVKVDGGVFLDAGFRADGEVSLIGATIGGELNCRGGVFSNPNGYALSADRVQVDGGVSLDVGFRADGEVRLIGATIGGDLSCVGGVFDNPGGDALSADGLQVQGSAYLRKGFEARGRVSFVTASVRCYLDWSEVASPRSATLDLRSARIGTLLDDEASWPAPGDLYLHGLVYDELRGHDLAAPDPASRKKWLALQRQDTFLPQPYEQLAKALRDSGDEEGATEILIAKNQDRARHTPHGLRRVLHWFFGVTTAYGYRPLRALWWALAVIILGWVLFRMGFRTDAMVYTKGLSDYRPEHWPLVYSIETFVPLVKLRHTEYWLPGYGKGGPFLSCRYFPTIGSLLCVYLWIETFAGWIITTLFVVGLTGLIRV